MSSLVFQIFRSMSLVVISKESKLFIQRYISLKMYWLMIYKHETAFLVVDNCIQVE